MRIGLLEDDKRQIELINLWLSESGDQLTPYTTGQSFCDAAKDENFDLIILDWHLPDMNGVEVLDWLRKEQQLATPILFITSQEGEHSVVEALDHGADDYMVKPVSKSVTLARIHALLRRQQVNPVNPSEESPQQSRQFSPYQFESGQQIVSKHDETIRLTHKEYELAEYLFLHEGCLVSRESLLETIWGTRGDLNTRTVDTHISRIRSKLGISPSVGWQLSSVYQRGYRLSRIDQS